MTIEHYRQNADGSWNSDPDDKWVTYQSAGTVLNRNDEAKIAMGLGSSSSDTFNTAYTGFRVSTTHPGSAATFTVTSDPLQNVFKIFYERGRFKIHYQYYTPSMQHQTTGVNYHRGAPSAVYVNGTYSIPPESDFASDPQWSNSQGYEVSTGVYETYFGQNTQVNSFPPEFMLTNGSWWRLLQWHAEWLNSADPTEEANGKYQYATFGSSEKEASNVGNVLWEPGSQLGIYQVKGPWDGTVVDVYLTAGPSWSEERYIVNFETADASKGTVGGYTHQVVLRSRPPYNDVSTNPVNPEEYAFDFWSTSQSDPNGVQRVDPFTRVARGDITYYAYWTEKATVIYEPGTDGTWNPADTTYEVKYDNGYQSWPTIPSFNVSYTDTTASNPFNAGNPMGNLGKVFTGWTVPGQVGRLSSAKVAALTPPNRGTIRIVANWDDVYVQYQFMTAGNSSFLDGTSEGSTVSGAFTG